MAQKKVSLQPVGAAIEHAVQALEKCEAEASPAELRVLKSTAKKLLKIKAETQKTCQKIWAVWPVRARKTAR